MVKVNEEEDKWQLDEEEKQILADYEAGLFVPVPNMEQEKERHRQIARNTLLKNKNISLRISEAHITKLKEKAAKAGLPYQTIISTLIHQYLDGRIKIEL